MDENIYVGIHEICDTTLLLSKGFRELGFEVTNVVENQSHVDHLPYGQEEYQPHDRYFDGSSNFKYIKNVTKELVTQAPKHDAFIFIAGTSFYGRLVYKRLLERFAYADLPFLKLMGKKIGIIANGSDLRSYELLIEELDDANLGMHKQYIEEFVRNKESNYDRINRVKAQKIQKHADAVFARPEYAQYLHSPNLFTVPVDVNKLNYCNNNEEEPLIIHAPTDTGLKGSKYVKDAIKKLENNGYKFRFELIQDMPNREFRKKLTESDIVVDQLLLPGHGLLAVEAMATGNVVVGSAVPSFNKHPKDIPIVTTTPDTIYENLRYLLDTPTDRNELIKKGRPFVEKNHSYKNFAKSVLDSLDINY